MYTAFANAVYITIDSVYFINSTTETVILISGCKNKIVYFTRGVKNYRNTKLCANVNAKSSFNACGGNSVAREEKLEKKQKV